MNYRVCFVCSGNICRSPIAEKVLAHRLASTELAERVVVDSAGTGGWHVGEPADPRTQALLMSHGYPSTHTARQWHPEWFGQRDLIVAMDTGHLRTLRRMAPDERARRALVLLREFDPDDDADADVPDPYYGGPEGFEEVLAIVEAAMDGLLERIREDLAARG